MGPFCGHVALHDVAVPAAVDPVDALVVLVVCRVAGVPAASSARSVISNQAARVGRAVLLGGHREAAGAARPAGEGRARAVDAAGTPVDDVLVLPAGQVVDPLTRGARVGQARRVSRRAGHARARPTARPCRGRRRPSHRRCHR